MILEIRDWIGIASGVSGIILMWRSYRIQSRSAIINDIDQIRIALKEENKRLQRKIEVLIRENREHKRDIGLLTERVEALEYELAEQKRKTL